jgi:hypothetical protein
MSLGQGEQVGRLSFTQVVLRRGKIKGDRMAFTSALYYPWIDITDSSWLKTSVLYWDKIRTIVPESLENPYSLREAQELEGNEILTPLRVGSDMEDIEELSEDVVKYLESPEAAQLLLSPDGSVERLHVDKLPRTVRRLVELHPEKLSYEVRNMIENGRIWGKRSGDWYEVDEQFAAFYMTLLATRLSGRLGASLLTPSPPSDNLARTVRLDNQPVSLGNLYRDRRREYELRGRRRMVPARLAEGLLVDLVLDRITLDPDTNVTKIIDYKNRYSAELGRLREKIAELAQCGTDDLPLEELRQRIYDTYVNSVLPAMEEVKKSLSGSGIRWLMENYLKVGLLSTSSTSVINLLHLSTPHALLVAAGVSVTASGVMYSLERKQALRQNPFAYLLRAERTLA